MPRQSRNREFCRYQVPVRHNDVPTTLSEHGADNRRVCGPVLAASQEQTSAQHEQRLQLSGPG